MSEEQLCFEKNHGFSWTRQTNLAKMSNKGKQANLEFIYPKIIDVNVQVMTRGEKRFLATNTDH